MVCNTQVCNTSKRALSQDESRQHKHDDENNENRNDDDNDNASQGGNVSSTNRLRFVIGTVDNKEVCVWCMKCQFKNFDENKKLLLFVHTRYLDNI